MNKELLHKAANYCSGTEHCISEVSEKLVKWGAQEDEIEPIIEYLVKEQYIDENRYCKAYVNDKLRFAKWGRQKIAYMLNVKRVDKQALSDAIASIDDQQYLDILTDVLKTKMMSLRSVESNQMNLKLYRFAASRGFESSEIAKAIKNIK